MIPELVLNRLHELGLFTSHQYGWGIWVVKPETTTGNNIAGFSDSYISIDDAPECPDTDAPMIKLRYGDGIWEVNGIDCGGGMGPADFCNQWCTAEEAIEDLRDFFFGDSQRMEAKGAYRRDPKGEQERALTAGRQFGERGFEDQWQKCDFVQSALPTPSESDR